MPTSPNAADHRSFLRRFGATLFGVLGVMALINFVVNPMGYYPTHAFQRPVWNSRREKMDVMLSARASRPNVLVLGSSRSMKLAPEDIQAISHHTAFNAAVSSATVEDYYAIYRFAKERCGWRPRIIVVGIDLDAFHESRASVLPDDAPELHAYVDPGSRWSLRLLPAAKLLSGAQLRMSLKSVRANVAGMPAPKHRIATDGFLHYTDWDEQLAAGTFQREPFDFEYYQSWHSFSRLSPDRLSLFGQFLAETQRDGVDVRAFVTPLHPDVRTDLRRTSRFDELHSLLVDELEDAAARHSNFRFADFTDPDSYQGDPDLFYDGVHQYRENARRMLARVLGGT